MTNLKRVLLPNVHTYWSVIYFAHLRSPEEVPPRKTVVPHGAIFIPR